MNVVKQHWFLAELNLRTWKVTIYDSATGLAYFKKYKEDGTFSWFGQCILKELEEIFYWDTVELSERKTHTPEFVETQNVPSKKYTQVGEAAAYFYACLWKCLCQMCHCR